MKKVARHLLIGTTMSIMASGAFATEAVPPQGAQARHAHLSPDSRHQRMDPAKFKEKAAQRQAELRRNLNLTPAQEPAWNAFAAAMTPPERGQRPDRAEWGKLTAPQRMERKLQGMQEMEAHMAKQLGAMKNLYGQLTPEQRTVFDDSMKKDRPHKHG